MTPTGTETPRAGRTGAESSRPRLFDPADPDDAAALRALRRGAQVVSTHDTLLQQLGELLQAREPARELEGAALDARVREHLGERAPDQYGRWAFYPWSGRLVHVLPGPELRELRLDRNRHKITADEQRRLGDLRVGIVGLSVGSSIAVLMAQQGVGGAFRLADPDALTLSSLNRVRAAVHELGLNKAVAAARAMAEIDPYLDVEALPRGVDPGQLDAFLDGIDLLVEECDDLPLKLRLRERARARRVPVLMATSDRGLIDIERFDLEPDRPLFHGLLGGLTAEQLEGLSKKELAPHAIVICGGVEQLSSRAVASILEVEESLSSWPQVAAEVVLGAAQIADAAQRLFLGEPLCSGRYRVDLRQLVGAAPGDVAAVESCAGIPDGRERPRGARGAATRGRPRPRERADEDLRAIIAGGIRAPSAGNCQPWRFRVRPGLVESRLDPDRPPNMLDFERSATHLTFGTAAENMALTAAARGLAVEVLPFPDPGHAELVFSLRIRPGAGASPPALADQIPRRITNRVVSKAPVSIEARACDAIQRVVPPERGKLLLVRERGQIAAMGRLMGACDRLCLLSARMHAEMMAELRWAPDAVESSMDGLDVRSLELSPASLAGLRVIANPSAMRFLSALGAGRALTGLARDWAEAASALGLLVVRGTAPQDYFDAGRLLQRVWLTSTMLGYDLHPITSLPYFFARLERGGGAGLSEDEQNTLRRLRASYNEVFSVPAGWGEALLFRVVPSTPSPSVRSLRRPVDDFIDAGA